MNKLTANIRRRELGGSLLRVGVTGAIAVAIAMAILALSCTATGYSVPDTFRQFFLGPVESSYELGEVLLECVPLLFTGTAVCIMNRCGQFNMFVEGAFFLGAFAAGVLAPMLPAGMPLIPFFCLIAAALICGALGYIPAKMKQKLGVDEFVTSLMLNYIVFWVVMFLLHEVWGDPDTVNKTRYLEDFMKLPFLDEDIRLSSNLLIAVGVCLLGGLFLFRTKWGYTIRMTGDNPKFAEYSGLKNGRAVVYSQVIGAMVAGFGGAAFLLGSYYRFEWTALPNYGFDGFVVAIIAGNNPLYVPFASLFLAYLRVGALQTARMGSVPNELIYVIQAVIIILFGAKTFGEMLKRRGGKKA